MYIECLLLYLNIFFNVTKQSHMILENEIKLESLSVVQSLLNCKGNVS